MAPSPREDKAAGPGTEVIRRRFPVGPVLAVAVIAAPVIAAIALALIVASASGGVRSGQALGGAGPGAATSNPGVDAGTRLPETVAPGFTLTDQWGRRVSLLQFRGKAVVLAFVDARCTTVCPLTTVSMTEAVSLLGKAAAKRVQLLGIDANPDATSVADVRAYSVAHQMMGSWHFLTGSKAQLAAVWRAYHVYVAASHGHIDHEPAVYLIDPRGRERVLYLTQMAYAGVAQQAQLLAGALAGVLPGHPVPRQAVSLKPLSGTGPGQTVSLPVIGGSRRAQRVQLGPGHPHVVVFLASWLSEVTPLASDLWALAAYQREAVRQGWPTVVAVDETPTETTPNALRQLVSRIGDKLGYPVAADTTGQLADGYGVRSLPWTELITGGGQIRATHDGWLTAAALARLAKHRT